MKNKLIHLTSAVGSCIQITFECYPHCRTTKYASNVESSQIITGSSEMPAKTTIVFVYFQRKKNYNIRRFWSKRRLNDLFCPVTAFVVRMEAPELNATQIVKKANWSCRRVKNCKTLLASHNRTNRRRRAFRERRAKKSNLRHF